MRPELDRLSEAHSVLDAAVDHREVRRESRGVLVVLRHKRPNSKAFRPISKAAAALGGYSEV
jgi:hypothetical protein